MRILVLNDEPSLRTAMTELLVHFGFEVESAADGDEAVRLCKTEGPFDLALTDFMHPGPRGTELVARIRQDNPIQRIVFLTGLEQHQMQDLRRELDEFSVLLWEGPIDARQLVDSINSLLGS